MLIGYVRVSTRDQNPEAQVARLRAAGVERIYTDHGASGARASRPEWDKCLRDLREGDQLVVTKLDRIGRSLANLIDVGADLRERKIALRVLDQGIDTTTAVGRMFYNMLGAFAEFERELMLERTADGLAAARANGTRSGRAIGRPPKLTPRKLATLLRLAAKGETPVAIAEAIGVSRTTVYDALRARASASASRSA